MLLAHGLSDKTTSEVMIQRQVVTQLKVQLKKESARLAAMMKHLYPGQTLQSSRPKRFRPESPLSKSVLNSLSKMRFRSGLGMSSSMSSSDSELEHKKSYEPITSANLGLETINNAMVNFEDSIERKYLNCTIIFLCFTEEAHFLTVDEESG